MRASSLDLGVKLLIVVTTLLSMQHFSIQAGQSDEHSSGIVDGVLTLKNGGMELKILPGVGGVVVFFGPQGGKNVLREEPAMWSRWESLKPDLKQYPASDKAWPAFFGHAFWMAPQTGFWNQQDVWPEKKGEQWPPDPYWDYGSYEVVEQGPDSVVLQGEASPYSGVSMRKTVRLDADGHAHLHVKVVNERESDVTWGIWSNTRVSAAWDARVIVGAGAPGAFRVEQRGKVEMPWTVKDGSFAFLPATDASLGSGSAKAFITPAEPCITACFGNWRFEKRFDRIDPGLVHPEQGAVEIYIASPQNKEDPGLLELEAHGPLRTLAAGESMEWSESWSLSILKAPDEDGNSVD